MRATSQTSIRLDPVELARRQLQRDHANVRSYAGLFEHKLERMRTSPLAFLRGSAPMFYDALAAEPSLAEGPAGEGWILGDLHLENFGVFRPRTFDDDERAKGQRLDSTVAFHLNDFDDAVIGPWRIDVLRLLVSVLLHAREMRLRGWDATDRCRELIREYVRHATSNAHAHHVPRAVTELIARVRTRSRTQLLDARTQVARGKRHLIRGPRYHDLPKKFAAAARTAFTHFARDAERDYEINADHFEIVDTAYRVAGTGSLGRLRVVVLARGKGGVDGNWMFDMKEQLSHPAPTAVIPAPALGGAERVVTAARALLASPPRMLGTARLAHRSMVVRRLAPQEDRLVLADLRPQDFAQLSGYLGSLVGSAHRRAATRPPKRAWTAEECDAMIDRAIVLAGVHEAAYVAYFKLARARR